MACRGSNVPPQRKFKLKIALGVVFILAAYCAGSGRLDLWPGWCYAGYFLLMLTLSHAVLGRVAPDLIKERVSVHAGSPQWDTAIVGWLAMSPIVTCLVAGLDARHNGVGYPLSGVLLGYSLAICGTALTHSAMAVNRFYAPTVRMQADRGHTVIEAGPYRQVRHPGNLGNVLLNAATPLMLASRWAWIPAGASILSILVRTFLEDRFLCAELPGYPEFVRRTRSRLLPGIW
jgi:protein-S-isoprenylcysteine O-methyltransferase Ste14